MRAGACRALPSTTSRAARRTADRWRATAPRSRPCCSARARCKTSRDIDPASSFSAERRRMPALVGPTGLNGLYWPRAEEVLARAAHDAGVPFVLSTASTSLIEDVRAASDGELWLQLYVQRERRIAENMMARAKAPRFPRADAHRRHHGPRQPRPLRAQRIPHAGAVDAAPARRLVTASALVPAHAAPGRLAAVRQPREERRPLADLAPHAAAMSRQMDMSLTWADLAWVRRHWDGPVIVKGILDPADARTAVAHGADGVVVSNHGGRQLESAPSALERLSAVVDAAGGKLAVFVDGGVRRGSDIAKAVALGAKAVLLGRAPLYGLAACGPQGAADVLAILRGEFETTLRLLGVPQARRPRRDVAVRRPCPPPAGAMTTTAPESRQPRRSGRRTRERATARRSSSARSRRRSRCSRRSATRSA